jgi:hypothetical protein
VTDRQKNEGTKKTGRLQRFAAWWATRSNRGRRILAAAGIGITMASAAWAYFWYGGGLVPDGLRAALIRSPPWLLLSGLASAPVLLLLWYWRDTLRQQDLAAREEANRREYRRLQQARFAAAREDAADESSEARQTYGLRELEKLAEEDDSLRGAVYSFVSERHGELKWESPKRVAERVMQAVGKRRRDAYQAEAQDPDDEGDRPERPTST